MSTLHRHYYSSHHCRSECYRLTVESKDDPLVESVRREVRVRNEHIRQARERYPVGHPSRPKIRYTIAFKARMGKDNPNREKYRTGSGRLHYQTVRHRDASRFDVYVHSRYVD